MSIRRIARNQPRRARATDRPQTTPRHLWLAGLGAVSVARREALAALATAFDRAARLRSQAGRFAGDARDVARGAAISVREQVEERVEPQVARFGAEIEARLAPVLGKLGMAPAPRKPVRATRKQATQPARRRNAAGRKQASTRVARKARR